MRELNLKYELEKGRFTCIAFKESGACYYSSKTKGILPLVELCEKNIIGEKLCLADKVTGKAAALLSVKCGAKTLYTGTVTQAALSFLNDNAVKVTYEKTVPFIKNRAGDGKCPMESLSNNVSCPDEMYDKIKAFLEGSASKPPLKG